MLFQEMNKYHDHAIFPCNFPHYNFISHNNSDCLSLGLVSYSHKKVKKDTQLQNILPSPNRYRDRYLPFCREISSHLTDIGESSDTLSETDFTTGENNGRSRCDYSS